MIAVIMSGGLGTRLKPFTYSIPKPLLPIGDKALLEIQIEQLERHGFKHIILATNYKSRYIENFFGDGSNYGVKLTISKEELPLGTAGPLALLSKYLTEPFLVMNGDILTRLSFSDMYKYAITHDSVMTIATKEIVTPSRFGNIFFEGEYITGVDEKPDLITTVMAGVYIFKPAVLGYIPINQYFGMDELILSLLNNRQKINRHCISEYWLDIGQINDFEKAQEIYKEHFQN